MSGRHVRWLRRMLPPGESSWVCAAARSVNVRKQDAQTDGRMDGRTNARSLHYSYC